MVTRARRRTSQAGPGWDGTAAKVLDVAERLVQLRGFNGFSYADIAAELGITTASLHYHFPGKAALGQALIARYAERFEQALQLIDDEVDDAGAKLERYAALYEAVLSQQRMCLCGVLAAEQETLPAEMRREVLRFFDANERWLERVLAAGRRQGSLRYEGPPGEQARLVMGTLEGAMLVARSYHDPARFSAAARRLLSLLGRSL